MIRHLCLITAFAVSASAAPSFVGAVACGQCHAARVQDQSATPHASALFRTAEHPLLRSLPDRASLVRDGQYRFEILGASDGVRALIDDGHDSMDLPYEWAFGAGKQAVTFVSRVNRDWYVEHYPSYYKVVGSWRASPGQDAVHPRTINEAAGVLYKITDPQFGIAGCFECHSTGPVSFDREGVAQVTEYGVRCESCHGAGSEHARDPAKNKLRASWSAEELNQFCGRCHRPPAQPGVAIDWNYAWNVRHEPVYLSQSACFLRSRGALSCLTCHNPHETGRSFSVNEKCVQCHPDSRPLHKSAAASQNPANCVDCHMPLVSPQPPLRFTNHWIGIYRTGSKLKPQR
jgi:hypothetical protein